MRWFVFDQAGGMQICDVNNSTSTQFDYQVRSQGCIAVGVSKDSLVIKAAPHRSQGQSFAAVTRFMQNVRPARIALLWYDFEWHEEVYSCSKDVRERLMSLILHADDTQRFHMRGRSMTSLKANHQLDPLIELWRGTSGSIELLASREAILNHTKSKYLVVKSDPSDDSVKFTEFGPGSYTVYGDHKWLTRCLGQPVQDQPDTEYGHWIVRSYRQAIQSNMPVLKDIDATVYNPANGTSRRMTYVRLTLPINGANGERLLLSTSCHDPDVDLRSPVR